MSSAEFKGKTGLVRLWNALGYSRDGLAAAWKNEAAFREEVLLAAIAIPLALFLGKTGVDRSTLIGSIILILIVERWHRRKYGEREVHKPLRERGLKRMFLHSHFLQLAADADFPKLIVSAAMPDELRDFLDKLPPLRR